MLLSVIAALANAKRWTYWVNHLLPSQNKDHCIVLYCIVVVRCCRCSQAKCKKKIISDILLLTLYILVMCIKVHCNVTGQMNAIS